MKKYSSTQRPEITQAILQKESFIICDIQDMKQMVTMLEKIIESNRFSCRIYTKNRIASAAAGLFSLGAGAIALTSIAIHNLATRNPDFEIAKDYINNQAFVTYMK